MFDNWAVEDVEGPVAADLSEKRREMAHKRWNHRVSLKVAAQVAVLFAVYVGLFELAVWRG